MIRFQQQSLSAIYVSNSNSIGFSVSDCEADSIGWVGIYVSAKNFSILRNKVTNVLGQGIHAGGTFAQIEENTLTEIGTVPGLG